MSFVATIRTLRHGPLKRFHRVFFSLGECYRFFIRIFKLNPTASHFIGRYGPFKLNGEFAFSNFANWDSKHNNGFGACVQDSFGLRCVFDVGAHIGLVTLPMSRQIAPDGQIFAFEPAPVNFKHLNLHLKNNAITNTQTFDFLVGDVDKDGVEFFEKERSSGQNSMVVKKDHQQYHAVQKKQRSIDSFCAERNLSPQLIKIDVEGAEILVLKGAKKTLASAKPKIYLSVHPHELTLLGSSVEELVALIHSYDYECFEMNMRPAKNFHLAEYILAPKN